ARRDPGARRPAAVGELPGAGLRLAADPDAGRVPELVHDEARVLAPDRELELGDLDHVRLPLAALHPAADLRRARAGAGVLPRGVERSRRPRLDHVPPDRL